VVAKGAAAPADGRPIEVRKLGVRSQDIGWLTTWIAARTALRGQRISLWHGFDPNAPLSPVSARRTVLTAYDLIPVHEPAAMAQIRRHRRAAYRMYLSALRRAHVVVAISQTTADDIVRTLGVPRERIRIVYPAVAPIAGIAPPAGTAPPSEAERPQEHPDLLFVGVPDPTKQPELAISALAELRRRGLPLKLRFAGYERPSDRTHLDQVAAAAGVSEFVEHLGRVADSELARLYRDSVLLALSRIEGFGLPPAESLVNGGRAVVGSAPAYREVLGDAADYAASDDGGAVADAYEAAALRPVRESPPADMVERFSPRAVAASLVAAYEDAL